MPSVIEGLSMENSGEIGEDPFETSLTAKLSALDESEESVTEAPALPQRDPNTGRFVSATPEEEEGTPEDVDVLKARLAEKDSFIGRQSTEIGELRSRLEALESSRREDEETPEISFIPAEMAERIIANRGPEGAVVAAIQEGLDPESQPFRAIFEAAAEAVETQSELADLVELRLRYRQAIEQPEQVTEEDPALEFARNAYHENVLTTVVADVRQRIPDFQENAAFFEKAAERAPEFFDAEINSGDPQRVQTALAILNDAARGIRFQASLEAKVAGGQAAEAARVSKQQAQVVTGGSPAVAAGGTPAPADDFLEKFREQFKAAQRPSVQDGLTLE